MTTSRRNLLTAAALSAAAWPLGRTDAVEPLARAHKRFLVIPERIKEHLSNLFGTSPIPLGGINLSLPALAENGNSVALGISIDPINAITQAHLNKLYVFAEKNPLPDILRCEFAAPSSAVSANSFIGRQQVDARIRLADSQRIITVAQYSDGTLSAGEAAIVVTLAACIDIPA